MELFKDLLKAAAYDCQNNQCNMDRVIILSEQQYMSHAVLNNPTTLQQNKTIHLPKSNDEKTKLYHHIDQYINQLKQQEGNDEKINILNNRKKLISKHGLSVERIDNLELIFLHYCSHIFKTGKHMTFERLQYEKNHMTMDRFFVFLKDFGLTTAVIDGVNREVFDKNELVLIFKKASVNCKDLNFEQFIACLERIALLYYDAKTHYKEKQEKIAKDRQKRKENYIKSLNRRKAALEIAHKKLHSEEKEDENGNEEKLTDQEDNIEEEANKKGEIQNNQNDKMVEELMNDKNVVDPEEQFKGQQGENEEEQNKQENVEVDKKQEEEHQKNSDHHLQFDREELLEFTLEEKIQYFYELINVDNATSFKKKMRQLNLPLFQTKHRRANSQAQPFQSTQRQPKLSVAALDQQQRLEELRHLIEERKQRDKQNSPQISKDEYEQRRKKRKVEEEKVMIKKFPRKKRIQVNELETDLSSLSKMEFDKINFRKFNPNKLYQPSQEDDIYLEEYYTSRKPERSSKRVLSSLESSDKNSHVLLERMKKRAQEIQARQRLEESKYEVNQEVGTSTEHQMRKNRLVEKLLKMHKS